MEVFLVTARLVDAPARRRLVLEHQPRGERVPRRSRERGAAAGRGTGGREAAA